MWWTVVEMSTPVLSEIDANPLSLVGGGVKTLSQATQILQIWWEIREKGDRPDSEVATFRCSKSNVKTFWFHGLRSSDEGLYREL